MSHAISLGDFQLNILSGGRLWIDGGNMFGVIPRALWQRKAFPDQANRIPLDTNCVLVRTPDTLGLIDTGYGSKAPEKVRQRYRMDPGMPLMCELSSMGIAAGDIDWVILSHLHFDHAGGCTYRDTNHELRPTFPRARHFVHRFEWDDASSNLPELAGSYFQDDFVPLSNCGLLDFLASDIEVLPGISTRLTGGHTRGHITVTLRSKSQSAVYTADICPTVAHLPIFWSMAYDQYPLTVRRVKPDVLRDIVDNQHLVLFAHDPHVRAGRLHVVDQQMQLKSEVG